MYGRMDRGARPANPYTTDQDRMIRIVHLALDTKEDFDVALAEAERLYAQINDPKASATARDHLQMLGQAAALAAAGELEGED